MRKDFSPALAAAMDHALEYLRTVDELPVGATVSLETLRQRLSKEWNQDPMQPECVVNDLARDIEGGLNNSVNARFYAWVMGGSLPSALAADWLTSTWDQNAGLYSVSPASAIVEEAVGSWLKELFRLPDSTSFALVTGCQMAHTTCLAAARTWLLKRRGWDVERQGMSGSPQIRLYCGLRHATIDRTLHLLGFGEQALTKLPVDDGGALDPAALEAALREIDGQPAVVLLQAGDVNTGGFDDFEALIPIARRYGAWTHIDGAFGMWAAASPRYERLVHGMDRAHSWATDGHKWLNVPYDCGYAFVAEPDAHRASMSYRASYLTQENLARDPLDWNPEFSRRARGFSRGTWRAGRRPGAEQPHHQPGAGHVPRSLRSSLGRVERRGHRRDRRGRHVLLLRDDHAKRTPGDAYQRVELADLIRGRGKDRRGGGTRAYQYAKPQFVTETMTAKN